MSFLPLMNGYWLCYFKRWLLKDLYIVFFFFKWLNPSGLHFGGCLEQNTKAFSTYIGYIIHCLFIEWFVSALNNQNKTNRHGNDGKWTEDLLKCVIVSLFDLTGLFFSLRNQAAVKSRICTMFVRISHSADSDDGKNQRHIYNKPTKTTSRRRKKKLHGSNKFKRHSYSEFKL